ncbi:MAG: hypothetical protein K6G31_00190 [Paludibacteraceae bacterium]|nr:hypothetical protein [Paludibacteraceae bacterium]
MALVDRIREGLRNLFKGVDASKSLQVVNGQTLEKVDETKRQHFDFEDDFNAGDDELVTFDDFETMSYTSSEKIEEERRKEEVRRAEEECCKEEVRRRKRRSNS